ncbi:hypothetical protein CPB84DRAFT_958054 [Gymnopilus junonius]|uniref:Uncharacterized protein n=1 Tax=Gymnopilus junonius TaxID=109634 RepID=A0A9P5NPS7_GYMJU|nr:hypothetical protein CPB84DRAFT_958054 [Gymnopilus junonius]
MPIGTTPSREFAAQNCIKRSQKLDVWAEFFSSSFSQSHHLSDQPTGFHIMSSAVPPQYTIPDLLAYWPWKRVSNSWISDIDEEANAWVKSFGLFEPEKFENSKPVIFNLLASFIGPVETAGHLRIACDLMNFYFAFDEYTDLPLGRRR